jgi:hypothetical protein
MRFFEQCRRFLSRFRQETSLTGFSIPETPQIYRKTLVAEFFRLIVVEYPVGSSTITDFLCNGKILTFLFLWSEATKEDSRII